MCWPYLNNMAAPPWLIQIYNNISENYGTVNTDNLRELINTFMTAVYESAERHGISHLIDIGPFMEKLSYTRNKSGAPIININAKVHTGIKEQILKMEQFRHLKFQPRSFHLTSIKKAHLRKDFLLLCLCLEQGIPIPASLLAAMTDNLIVDPVNARRVRSNTAAVAAAAAAVASTSRDARDAAEDDDDDDVDNMLIDGQLFPVFDDGIPSMEYRILNPDSTELATVDMLQNGSVKREALVVVKKENNEEEWTVQDDISIENIRLAWMSLRTSIEFIMM